MTKNAWLAGQTGYSAWCHLLHGALQHYVASSTRAVLIYVDPPQFTVNLAQSVCRERIELLHVELRGAVWEKSSVVINCHWEDHVCIVSTTAEIQEDCVRWGHWLIFHYNSILLSCDRNWPVSMQWRTSATVEQIPKTQDCLRTLPEMRRVKIISACASKLSGTQMWRYVVLSSILSEVKEHLLILGFVGILGIRNLSSSLGRRARKYHIYKIRE